MNPATLALHGDYARAKRRGKAPQPPASDGKCPGWIGASAKAFWKKHAPEMVKLGLLSVLDESSFTILCVEWGGWKDAVVELAKIGETYSPSGSGLQKRHPLCAIADMYRNGYMAMAPKFGFDPSSRQRLTGIEPAPEPDELDEFLNSTSGKLSKYVKGGIPKRDRNRGIVTRDRSV
jgi:P27 family predicted phage terminase small subunit